MGKKHRISPNNSFIFPKEIIKQTDILCSELLEKCTFISTAPNMEEFCQIYDLTNKLIDVQKMFIKQHAKRDEKAEEFIGWLKSNGSICENVILHKFSENNYGIKALKDLDEHELVMQIPYKLMLSQSTAKNSLLGKLLHEDKIVSCLPNVFVALHLLCEYLTESSFWRPYLDMLPEKYNTLLYFTLEDLKMLKGSPIVNEVMNQYKSIVRQYAYFFKLFQNKSDFSRLPIRNFYFEDYRWAVSTVQTRQNCIKLNDDLQLECTLIPLFDMCNHSYGNVTTGYNKEKKMAECYSMKKYKSGEEFKIFYGDRSNSEFFIHNGFIPDKNINKLLIKLGVSKSDSLYSMKADILARIPINMNQSFFINDDPDCPFNCEVIAFLRVFHMDLDQLKIYLMSEDAGKLRVQLLDVDYIFDINNELKVWQFLVVRCKLLHDSYSQKTDEEQLETEIKFMINKLIRSEKKILINAINFCSSHLEKLKL